MVLVSAILFFKKKIFIYSINKLIFKSINFYFDSCWRYSKFWLSSFMKQIPFGFVFFIIGICSIVVNCFFLLLFFKILHFHFHLIVILFTHCALYYYRYYSHKLLWIVIIIISLSLFSLSNVKSLLVDLKILFKF